MPSTFVHGLLPTSCLALTRNSLPPLTRAQWVRLLFIASILGNSPDIDVLGGAISPEHFYFFHRSFGHNIFALTLFVLLGRWSIRRFVTQEFSSRALWIISTTLVISHVFLDAMGDFDTHGQKYGVPLFYPFSEVEFFIPFTLFRHYHLNAAYRPLIGHLLSPDYWIKAASVEIISSFSLALVWAGGYRLVRLLTQFRSRKTPPDSANIPINIEEKAA